MATFPALEPATRSYDAGRFPVTVASVLGSAPVRFRHGTIAAGHVLRLGFVHLTAAEASLIRTHYRVQRGSYLAFDLSTEAWRGHSSMTDLVPSTTLWRYASAPQETHASGGLYDVTVELAAVT